MNFGLLYKNKLTKEYHNVAQTTAVHKVEGAYRIRNDHNASPRDYERWGCVLYEGRGFGLAILDTLSFLGLSI